MPKRKTYLYYDHMHWPQQLQDLAKKILKENMSDHDAGILKDAAEAFQTVLDNVRFGTPLLKIEDPTPGIVHKDEVQKARFGTLGQMNYPTLTGDENSTEIAMDHVGGDVVLEVAEMPKSKKPLFGHVCGNATIKVVGKNGLSTESAQYLEKLEKRIKILERIMYKVGLLSNE